jgi:ABC-type sugar transport system permease subunit
MKYWAFLVAKLAVVAAVLFVLLRAIGAALPKSDALIRFHQDPFAHDLLFTFVMMLYSLVAAGLVWAAIFDQRYRCRNCLRRLRMPIHRGSWNHVLLGAPRTEYICLFGHGTLTVAELQITGMQNPDWEPHQDIWTELYSLDETK